MNQTLSHRHFPGVLPESVERDGERRDRAQRIPIDPLRMAVWGTFFAAILLFWAFVAWLAVG
jgi:hypothetical protein